MAIESLMIILMFGLIAAEKVVRKESRVDENVSAWLRTCGENEGAGAGGPETRRCSMKESTKMIRINMYSRHASISSGEGESHTVKSTDSCV